MVPVPLDALTSPVPFGRYRLLKRIGSGGMAEVFLAEAPGIGGFEKLLCLKCIRKERAADADFIRLLVEEAKIVSLIVHPNVAQVFDLGCVDDRYYIAMEYVDGVDAFSILRAAAERGVHLPVPAAALIVRELANGLAAAHGQADASGTPLHIIHRDISPHNVLVSFDGDVKIIDFGVAKATLRAATTQAGVIKGKYNYLSPEQAHGAPLDHRTDIFSAGIVLFELLAGEPLYPGEQIADLLDQTRRAKVPPLRRYRPDVPKPLLAILAKALDRNLERRYASAQAMSADLDTFLAGQAEGYGPADLAALLAWLMRDQPTVPQAPPAVAGARGEPTAKIATFASRARSVDELEAEPTRVANPDDIRARRQARAAGFEVPPTPIGVRPRRRSRRPWIAGALVVALAVAAGLWVSVRCQGAPAAEAVHAQ